MPDMQDIGGAPNQLPAPWDGYTPDNQWAYGYRTPLEEKLRTALNRTAMGAAPDGNQHNDYLEILAGPSDGPRYRCQCGWRPQTTQPHTDLAQVLRHRATVYRIIEDPYAPAAVPLRATAEASWDNKLQVSIEDTTEELAGAHRAGVADLLRTLAREADDRDRHGGEHYGQTTGTWLRQWADRFEKHTPNQQRK